MPKWIIPCLVAALSLSVLGGCIPRQARRTSQREQQAARVDEEWNGEEDDAVAERSSRRKVAQEGGTRPTRRTAPASQEDILEEDAPVEEPPRAPSVKKTPSRPSSTKGTTSTKGTVKRATPPSTRRPAVSSAQEESETTTVEPETTPPAATAAEKSVAVIIQELQDPLLAGAAYRRITEAPRSLIPAFIRQVENPTPSRVERLGLVVLDPSISGEAGKLTANAIPGLGKMEMVQETAEHGLNVISQGYTRMSYGLRDQHYRVILEKAAGFPLGVVVRAGLMNRIQSTRYPVSSDDSEEPGALIKWWQEYFELAKADIPPP